MDRFDTISPLDFRYYAKQDIFEKLQPYLSERAAIKYMARVEAAVAQALAGENICTQEIADTIRKACEQVTVEEVYEEEKVIKHNIRALVNCIRKHVPEKAKPFVHLTCTSHDIICTAEALRIKEVIEKVILPDVITLEKLLIAIALREKDTIQIGRTHGQHAVPITVGFALSEYVARIGESILSIRSKAANLRGKLSGAVGAYNAASLILHEPERFEERVLLLLGLKPATHSTQIVAPEFMLECIHSIIVAYGVCANLSDDMRHLQRSEIGEVAEQFDQQQVGSSTMPHKRNPINFENVKSLWKTMMPRMITLYMDQISEHQRDLTNSASSRFIPEIIAAFCESINRLQKQMEKMTVDRDALNRNMTASASSVVSEALYILLAQQGHPDAHHAVLALTHEAQNKKMSVMECATSHPELMSMLNKMTPAQKEIVNNPSLYRGLASKKTEKVCNYWRSKCD
ncbi:MAG TPA: lyase family protein [Candidatus Nanoarchaeia archaeon]|nr:lyase family protein [Candidatus Nanoarchaeia archaeon]